MKLRSPQLKGFTLVEMLVAIFIMFMGMIGFSLLFSSSWKSNKFTIETGVTAIQVNRAVQDVVNNLRKVKQADNGDYPIKSGTGFDLVVYADIDNNGTTDRIHYWLDSTNQRIRRGVTPPNATSPVTYPSGDTTTTTVANYITNSNTQPIFYYYNQNYPGDTTNNPLPTPVAVQNVRLVRVFLRMNIDPVRAPNNINVESFADMRNLESYGE